MSAPTGPTDLALLRRHEPILRFTDGELFFPMPTDHYVEACDLLAARTLRDARVQVPVGELDLERLAASADELEPGESQFLRFVQKPLSPLSCGDGVRTRRTTGSAPPGDSRGSA